VAGTVTIRPLRFQCVGSLDFNWIPSCIRIFDNMYTELRLAPNLSERNDCLSREMCLCETDCVGKRTKLRIILFHVVKHLSLNICR
jgi:hypothetical protein